MEGPIEAREQQRRLAAHRGWLGQRDTILVWLAALGTGGALIASATRHDGPWLDAELALSWLLATLPLVYLARGRSLTALVCGLYFAWIGLVALGSAEATDRILFVPVLALTSGLTLFQVGGTHYALSDLILVGRTTRLAGLGVGLAGLYVLPFEAFGFEDSSRAIAAVDPLEGVLIVLCGVGSGLVLINQGIRCLLQTRLTRSEGPISLGLFALIAAYVLLPLPWGITALLFNLAALLLCLSVLGVSVWRNDGLVFYIAAPCLLALFMGWYVDLVWDRLEPVMAGVGLVVVLVISALALAGVRVYALPPAE